MDATILYIIVAIVIIIIVIVNGKKLSDNAEPIATSPEGFVTNKYSINSNTIRYIPKQTNNTITKILENKREVINPVSVIANEENKIIQMVEASRKDGVDPTIPMQTDLIQKPIVQEHELFITNPPKERFRTKITKTRLQMAKTIASGTPNYMD